MYFLNSFAAEYPILDLTLSAISTMVPVDNNLLALQEPGGGAFANNATRLSSNDPRNQSDHAAARIAAAFTRSPT